MSLVNNTFAKWRIGKALRSIRHKHFEINHLPNLLSMHFSSQQGKATLIWHGREKSPTRLQQTLQHTETTLLCGILAVREGGRGGGGDEACGWPMPGCVWLPPSSFTFYARTHYALRAACPLCPSITRLLHVHCCAGYNLRRQQLGLGVTHTQRPQCHKFQVLHTGTSKRASQRPRTPR